MKQVLCMVACWAEDPNGVCFKKHLARVPDFIWIAEDGMKMQVCSYYYFFKTMAN